MIKITKGLNVPISGSPVQTIHDSFSTKLAAVIGADFKGMKPTMAVKVGDQVKIGQVLFTDKKNSSVIFTSPCSGTVKEVNRGEKRVFQSLVIERSSSEEFVEFQNHKNKAASAYSKQEAIDLLLESGHWTNFRTRPFSKCPDPTGQTKAIFVTASDTHPLAADPGKVIEGAQEEFSEGLTLLTHLTEGKVHVCSTQGSKIPGKDIAKTQFTQFSGPHPSGNVGTHIHHLEPVSAKKSVWHINYQDVIAIGHLLKTAHLKTDKVISLAGPKIKEPRLVKVNRGACVSEIVDPNKKDGQLRSISGSVLSGRTAAGAFNYLGHFHSQISVIQEGMEREFFGWQKPGFDKYTVTRAYFGKYFKKFFDFTSSAQGSLRAMVPIGNYEKVLPLDILPTQLLRALLSYDTDQAQALGCLELDEEDLSLCSFVCSSKINFGPKLRENLNIIEKEG